MKLQKIKKAAFAAVVSVMMAGTLAGCGQKSGETQAPASQGKQGSCYPDYVGDE